MIGGPDLTDPRDCLCYLVLGSQATVMIDCGSGPSVPAVLDLAVRAAKRAPSHLLITHAHIDHAGGAAEIKRRTGCRVVMHAADAGVLARGDVEASAATWYGLPLPALSPDQIVDGDGSLDLGGGRQLHLMHTPGHTPGSLTAWCQSGAYKVVFAQDVHGPFLPSFGSDVGLWRQSMGRVLALDADVLAEGHYGVFRPASEVRAFLEQQLAAH